MNCTKICFLVAGLAFAVLSVGVNNASAGGAPHDAGFKARGMHDAYHAPRVMRSSAPAAAVAENVRQSFSYNPVPAAPSAADNAPAPAPSPRVYRSYSYQPAAPAMRFNVRRLEGTSSTHGGNYKQKALLY